MAVFFPMTIANARVTMFSFFSSPTRPTKIESLPSSIQPQLLLNQSVRTSLSPTVNQSRCLLEAIISWCRSISSVSLRYSAISSSPCSIWLRTISRDTDSQYDCSGGLHSNSFQDLETHYACTTRWDSPKKVNYKSYSYPLHVWLAMVRESEWQWVQTAAT